MERWCFVVPLEEQRQPAEGEHAATGGGSEQTGQNAGGNTGGGSNTPGDSPTNDGDGN